MFVARNPPATAGTVCAATALILALASSLPAQSPTFTGVGVLPGDTSSTARSVSRNGGFVTGESVDATGPEAFIYVTDAASKTGIGFPSGWTTTSGEGIDADVATGTDIYVAGTGKNGSAKDQAFFYDATAGTFTAIPFLTGGDTSKAHAIQCASSGDVLVTGRSDMTPEPGHSLPFYHAYRWRKNSPGASLNLDDPPTDPDDNGNLAEAWCLGIRPNGATVIRGFTNESGYPNGSHNPMAWTWYSGDSTTSALWWADLSSPPSPRNSNARGTSADGRYITGASTIEDSICESNRVAYLHDTDDKDVDASCNPPGGHHHPLQYCVVPDGSGGSGCIWGSTMLGELAGHEGRSEGLGVSLDGQVVVGWARKLLPDCSGWGEDHTVAFIWDPVNGMRDLKTVLEGLGLQQALEGWQLWEATSISSDGTVICGIGHHTDTGAGIDRDEGWVATIGRVGPMGACCVGLGCVIATRDECVNQLGGTFLGDSTCSGYLCCPDPFADVDGDGDVDMDDYGRFQVCYTGTGNGVLENCTCFDRPEAGFPDGDGDVDEDDYGAFEACSTGPEIPLDPACDD